VAWFWQGQRRSLDELSQRKVLAFAGIAGPSRFFHTLHQLGAQVVGQHAFPDHHPFRPQELALLAKKAEQTAALLFTTAKDHVRLPLPWAQQVAYLEVTLVPLAGSFSQLLPPFG
jgi:tetraacyldisaccharide 4'-kinase